MRSFLIEVDPCLKGSSEGRRLKIEKLFQELGFGKLECVKIAALYRLEGELSQSEAERISKEILRDSVAESFVVDPKPQDEKTFFVDIWYKKGVTDSVGVSLLKAIKDIGINTVTQAAHGERILFHQTSDLNNSETLEKKVVQFVDQNLLNPLVQECKLTGLC